MSGDQIGAGNSRGEFKGASEYPKEGCTCQKCQRARKGAESRYAPPRHEATAAVWDWLDRGDGSRYPETLKRTIRLRLCDLDAQLILWDKEHDAA